MQSHNFVPCVVSLTGELQKYLKLIFHDKIQSTVVFCE